MTMFNTFHCICFRRALIVIACIIAATPVVAQTVGASAPPPIGDKNGSWSLPLRYWSHQYVFDERDSFIFLTKVTWLGNAQRPKGEKDSRPFFREGSLSVLELLRGDIAKYPQLKKVKTLAVEGCNGLKVGDRLVVFVDSEPYEGLYVINFHRDASSILGIRLPPDDLKFGRDEQENFLRMLRGKQDDIQHMSIEHLQLWSQVDPNGVSNTLVRAIEGGRLRWKTE
jgi:hypothetical protein